jgi:hypothetical protein
MASRNKIFITLLSLLAALFISAPLLAASKNQPASVDVEPFLPVWALQEHELTVVSVAPVVVGDKTVGAVTVYDDENTQRPADYWELYDSEGALLAARWFDQFGIKRTAVDRGFLEAAGEPEGVLVVVLNGDSI